MVKLSGLIPSGNPRVIDTVLDAVYSVDYDSERQRLEEERRRLALESTHLTTAIAAGGNIPELVKQLQERDKRLRELDAKLTNAPARPPDRQALERALMQRQQEWRDILRSQHVQQARVVLQHLVDLPVQITNEPAPRWIAQGKPHGLTVGISEKYSRMASPPGLPAVGVPVGGRLRAA